MIFSELFANKDKKNVATNTTSASCGKTTHPPIKQITSALVCTLTHRPTRSSVTRWTGCWGAATPRSSGTASARRSQRYVPGLPNPPKLDSRVRIRCCRAEAGRACSATPPKSRIYLRSPHVSLCCVKSRFRVLYCLSCTPHPPPHPLGTIFFAPSKLPFQDPDESGSQSSEEVELVQVVSSYHNIFTILTEQLPLQEEEEKKDM